MNEFIDKLIGRLEEESYQETMDDLDPFGDIPRMVVSLNKSIEIVNELAEEYNNGWIACNERLPSEKDGAVLICDEKGEVSTGKYSEYSETWYKGDMCAVGGADVIAWQPLPPVWKGIEDGKK